MEISKNVKSLVRVLLCSLPMGFIAYLICTQRDWSTTGGALEKIPLLLAGIIAGLGVYLICAYWMKNEEMIFLMKMLKRKSLQ